jgi:cell division protein FtsB
MTLEEAMARIADLEAENEKLKNEKETLREIAKRYFGRAQRLNYEYGVAEEKHQKATAIIADMGGY